MHDVITFMMLLGGGVAFIAIWFLLPFALRRREEKTLREACRREGIIVLTFDDGPGQSLTSRLLSLLKDLKIKASFFMLGNRAVKSPQILLDLVEEGHEIGGHTSRHLNAWKSLPHAHCQDLIEGQKQIAGITGQANLFRPAYGKMSLASFILAKMKKLNLAWWTIDAKDSLEDPRAHDDVLEDITANGGGIVLLHDYDSYPNTDHDGYVLSLVQKIHDLAEKLGLRFATYSELLDVVRHGSR